MLEQLHQCPFMPCIESIVERLRRHTPCPGASGQTDALQGHRAPEVQSVAVFNSVATASGWRPVVGVERGPGGEEDRRAHVLGA